MTKHKRKGWKGCCMLCAMAKGKFLTNGKDSVPWAVRRRLGRKRRLNGDQ